MVPTRFSNNLFFRNSNNLFSRYRHTLDFLLSFAIYFVWVASILRIPGMMFILCFDYYSLITYSRNPFSIHLLSRCWLKSFVTVLPFQNTLFHPFSVTISCANKSLLYFLSFYHLVCPVFYFSLPVMDPQGNPAATLLFYLESCFQNLPTCHFSIISHK